MYNFIFTINERNILIYIPSYAKDCIVHMEDGKSVIPVVYMLPNNQIHMGYFGLTSEVVNEYINKTGVFIEVIGKVDLVLISLNGLLGMSAGYCMGIPNKAYLFERGISYDMMVRACDCYANANMGAVIMDMGGDDFLIRYKNAYSSELEKFINSQVNGIFGDIFKKGG